MRNITYKQIRCYVYNTYMAHTNQTICAIFLLLTYIYVPDEENDYSEDGYDEDDQEDEGSTVDAKQFRESLEK